MENNKYYDSKKINRIDRLLTSRKTKEAYDAIQEYINDYPKDYLIYIYYALCLSHLGKRDSALDLARRNIRLDFHTYKNSIRAYTIYADVMVDNGFYDEAIEYYKKAIDLSIEKDTVAKARIKLINLYMSKFDYNSALELCIGHDHLNNILVKEASIYISLKNYSKAKEILDKIQMDKISLDFSANAYTIQNINYLYGDTYYHLHDYDNSKKHYNKALQPVDSPLYAKSLAGLGYIALHDLDYNTAINYAYKIIKETKSNYYGYELLASVYIEKKDKDKAQASIANITNGYRRNQKQTEFYYKNNDYQEAEKYICKVLSNDLEDEHTESLAKYALILLRLGKINTLRSLYNYIICNSNISNEALDYIKECIEISDNSNNKIDKIDYDDERLNIIKTRN